MVGHGLVMGTKGYHAGDDMTFPLLAHDQPSVVCVQVYELHEIRPLITLRSWKWGL